MHSKLSLEPRCRVCCAHRRSGPARVAQRKRYGEDRLDNGSLEYGCLGDRGPGKRYGRARAGAP